MSIKVTGLNYIYSQGLPGETAAVKDVSFEIHDGETVGLIGHTGSGKSTLLQLIDALIKPASGKIEIDGTCITDGSAKLADVRRKVGLVFQYPEYQLFEDTVEHDVAFGPKNLGVTGEELDRRVRDAIEKAGLDFDTVKDMSPFELSGGQKRRAAIAGVVAMDPRILILDEPTAGLDPEAHDAILEMIDKIRKDDTILILVSHDMDDVAKLCDRIIVMDEGKIVMDGDARYIFSKGEMLKKLGLTTPAATETVQLLAEKLGVKIKEVPLNVSEAGQAVKQLSEKLKA
jgi:energy-coupling factor transporter ATPase